MGAVGDFDHGDDAAGLVDLVDDPKRTAAGDPEALELEAQLLAETRGLPSIATSVSSTASMCRGGIRSRSRRAGPAT